jgi:hypothetical protein
VAEFPDGCGDAEWAEFGVAVGVFVEAEKIDFSEVGLDHVLWYIA